MGSCRGDWPGNFEINIVNKYPYYWRVKTRLPERKGDPCRVLARGKMNSTLIEFEDGYKVVTSRNYIRVRKQEGFFCPKCGTVYPEDIGLGCLGCK